MQQYSTAHMQPLQQISDNHARKSYFHETQIEQVWVSDHQVWRQINIRSLQLSVW